MPTSADPLLLDTSCAIALVQPQHAKHGVVREVLRGKPLGLAGHAEFETYSVLTRLPAPSRLTPAAALRLISVNFPATRRLPASRAATALQELASLGLAGGATYDGLVGLAARHHDLRLASSDLRAVSTYHALGIDVLVL
ncbi:MAG: type II toxin-antitoxin system VapC family toxin [Nocardioidaceae bacterium]|nr:MAG: type II toxin-antitoxin system VapC family toxin [Nocardioidaceae bacterium]